jgi:hypothetical protein
LQELTGEEKEEKLPDLVIGIASVRVRYARLQVGPVENAVSSWRNCRWRNTSEYQKYR